MILLIVYIYVIKGITQMISYFSPLSIISIYFVAVNTHYIFRIFC